MVIILLLFNLGIYGYGINSCKGKDWSDKIKQAKKFIKKKQFFFNREAIYDQKSKLV
jgi:hypothetical protein